MDRFYGREEVVPKFKHRFKIFEPTTQIDRYIDQTLDTITGKDLDFVNILHNIHLIFSMDASELLASNDDASTRYLKFYFFITRLDHLLFLYDVARSKDGMNRHFINDWKRMAQRFLRDNVLQDQFSYTLTKEIKEKLDRIANL
jgi:hypothetical protein